MQPASSSDSEGNDGGGGGGGGGGRGSDEEDDDDDDREAAVVPQKVESGSEVDSDSGSDDRGRAAPVKRKPPATKVIVGIH